MESGAAFPTLTIDKLEFGAICGVLRPCGNPWRTPANLLKGHRSGALYRGHFFIGGVHVTAKSSAGSKPALSPHWRDALASDRIARLREELARRVLILDGGMGTMVQAYRLSEEDYRGERFKDHPHSLMGAGDLLALTRPHVLSEIHQAYLDAGSSWRGGSKEGRYSS